MLVNEFLENSASRHPDKVALVCDNKRYTFSHINVLSNKLAHALIKNSLQKQERVAILLDNSVEAVIGVFATLKAGGVFLIINPLVKSKKAKYIIHDCQVKILITDVSGFKVISECLQDCSELEMIILVDQGESKDNLSSGIPQKIEYYSEILRDELSTSLPNKCIDIDLASLIYTSGSTGFPKGVMLTHLNMVSAAASIIEYLENTPDDIILNVFPLSFDYGLYQVLMAFKFGGTVVLEKSFFYPYKIIDLIKNERVTGLPIVPTVASILFKLKNLRDHDFSSLRYITTTGQAMPPVYIERIRELLPHVRFYSMYGLSECKRVSYLPPDELGRRPSSVGKAMPNTEVYIIDENGEKVTKPGVIGELVVRGTNVMKGYWNLPEETDRYLKPGLKLEEKVLFTGDLFKMDEDGFLYFVSRKDDILNIASANVSPKEIENVLYEMQDVLEAAVVGVEDQVLGQAAKAFIVLKDESKVEACDILLHCSHSLEKFMVPKYIEIRDNLPKSSHGKIEKKLLT